MAGVRIRMVVYEQGKGTFRINTQPGLTNVFRTFMKQTEEIRDKLVASAAMAARHEAEYQFALTQEQVPVKTGELQRSGRVEGPDLTQKFIMANIAYGGPPGINGATNTILVDYALPVHENLYAHHPVGKAKYVEDVVRDERESGRTLERMTNEIRGRMGWS